MRLILLKQFDKILKVCGKPQLNLSNLVNIGKYFSDLLSQNPQNEGRSEILGKIIDSRIKETSNLLENTQSHHFYFAKRNSSNF